MNLYYMTRPTKFCRVKFACIIVYPTLVVYYHAHCSIAYLACCADMVGIVTLVTVRSKNARQDMEEGGT